MLEKKSVSGISVSELCNRSKVNRSTFYRYYADIYDLYEKLQTDMSESARSAFFKPVEEGCRPFSKACFQSLFQYVSDNISFYSKHIRQSRNAQLVNLRLNGQATVDISSLIRAANLESSDEEDYRRAYFDGGINAILRYWIQTNCRVLPTELAYFMEKEYQYEVVAIERIAENNNI
jgi:AcrR family transcriptional regulator